MYAFKEIIFSNDKKVKIVTAYYKIPKEYLSTTFDFFFQNFLLEMIFICR